MNRYTSILVTALIGLLATTVNATPILCNVATNNHMSLDSAEVSACVAGGIGNINGNILTDDFLTGGGTAAGYVDAGVTGSFTQTDANGTWSIDSSVDAIGFKFGTGNQPDEWFVYDLVAGVTFGSWDFINVFGRGGGLSHLQTYNKTVPEPGVLALLATGLIGIAGVTRRRMKI